MATFSRERDWNYPERVIDRLIARLRNHALWDSLLIFGPPLAVAVYIGIYLHRSAWIAATTFLLVSLAFFGVALAAVVLRYRPLVPSIQSAARMVDERTAAQDRFVTLATIESPSHSASLVARLRREAAGFLRRMDFRKDFPYRIKRSFYWSLLGSFAAVIMFHSALRWGDFFMRPPAPREQLGRLAQEMAAVPRFAELARALEALAVKLRDPDIPNPEKQALMQEVLKKLEEQRRNEEEQSEGAQLLGQAANSVRGLEQGLEKSQERDRDKGGGSVATNLPQDGQGKGKSAEGGGESQGEMSAELTRKLPEGKSAQGEPQGAGKEKGAKNQGAGKGADAEREKEKEMTGEAERGAAEKVGKSKSEEIPRGAPPAERFLQPGEKGKEGVKGARFVTVQLPEEISADAAGGEGPVPASRGRPKVPISNVPLPAHVPDAPAEKQPLPLEYRSIIR